MRKLILTATTCLVISGAAFAQSNNGIFNETEVRELQGQDIDANTRLLEALSRAAKKGPKFRVSPDKVFMELSKGAIGAETVRISNVGDEDGALKGVNPLGSIEGLVVNDNCPDVLSPGAFCDVAVRFESNAAQNVYTVIVVSIEERDRSSFDIPIKIEVSSPVENTVDPEEIARELERIRLQEQRRAVVIKKPEMPKGQSSQEIARMYFGKIGGPHKTTSNSGFTIVSLPDKFQPQKLLGVEYSDIRRDFETTDERYDEEIFSTEASLPVDRKNILTSDRVIKAVLDTPVSNVMCGKVVAVVESDVYSATSGSPLIQAGSRVIGSCGAFAEERVGIAWNRIITTDGRSITFSESDAATSDASGLGGGLGRVYRSNFDIFVLPIFSTMIDTASGLIYAAFGDDETVVTQSDGQIIQERSAVNEGIGIVTDSVGVTSKAIIEELRDVREVMVLPSGSRIDIEISEDIYFKNRREIIRVADTKYNVDEIERQSAEEQDPEDLILIPYRKGVPGPTVVVRGERFVVMEKASLSAEEDPEVMGPAAQGVVSDLVEGN
jgi:type IV secretory pathway VirB10-like protein